MTDRQAAKIRSIFNNKIPQSRLQEEKTDEICDLFDEAIQKFTEMEPVNKEDEFGDSTLVCPTCGNPVINYFNQQIDPPNCMMCGQKLLWRQRKAGE